MNLRLRPWLAATTLVLVMMACRAPSAADDTNLPIPPVSYPPPGSYPAASAGLLCNTNCTFRTGLHREDAFLWSFARDTFSIRGDQIPAELLALLGIGNRPPKVIEGSWSFGGQEVLLRVSAIDGRAAESPAVGIPLMRTGPQILRLTIANEQFVFHG